MKNALWLIITFAVSALPAATPPPVARDLSKYSTRGPYVLFYHHVSFYTDEDHALINSQMRQFFLDCWQKHQRGRLITVEFSIEGLPTRSTYFIEPDSTDRWHVVVNSMVALDKGPDTDWHYSDENTTNATLETVTDANGKKRVRIVSGGRTILEL